MKQKYYINKQILRQNSDEIPKLFSLQNCIIIKKLNGALFSCHADDVSTAPRGNNHLRHFD
jgi:hypothetical protein